MIVLPVASITCAPGRAPATSPRRPTARMRLPSTTTVPSSITSSPRMVTTRPPTSATVPVGTSYCAWKPMLTPCVGRVGQLLRRALEEREGVLQLAREELGPERPVEPLRVAGPVQVLAGVARHPGDRDRRGLRADLDRLAGRGERRDVGVEALARRPPTAVRRDAELGGMLGRQVLARSSLPSRLDRAAAAACPRRRSAAGRRGRSRRRSAGASPSSVTSTAPACRPPRGRDRCRARGPSAGLRGSRRPSCGRRSAAVGRERRLEVVPGLRRSPRGPRRRRRRRRGPCRASRRPRSCRRSSGRRASSDG